jgi:uncharacterized OsmC-like protein
LEAIDMATRDIAAAMQRVEKTLQRRPETGIHDDASATARWESGTRIVASHANGAQVLTDMPNELGGSGDQVSPGWLFRAGVASCLATCIAMNAAAEQIELTTLEVFANSRSDLRGLLGMADAAGEIVSAGPSDVQLRISIAARGASPERLRILVDDSCHRSPMLLALRNAVPVDMRIDAAVS